MNDLYYPKKKSKLEEYQEKLKERELYSNYLLDRAIENGSGAPRHDQNGNLDTKIKDVSNEEYEEDNIIQQNKNTPSFQRNNNTNSNNLYNTFSNRNNRAQNQNNVSTYNDINPRLYQSFKNGQSNLNLQNGNNNNYNNNNQDYNNNTSNNNINQRYNNINNDRFINTLDQNQLRQLNQNNFNNNLNDPYLNNNIDNQNGAQNRYLEENSTNYSNMSNNIKNINNNKKNLGNESNEEYQGLGILPRKSDDNKIQRRFREEALKETLEKEIEERRIKKELEKKRQQELDLKEDLKVKKAIEEEKEALRLEKMKKEALEQKLMQQNLKNIEKNKKKKNLIDIDEYYGKEINFKNYKNNNNQNQQNQNVNNQDINNNQDNNTNDSNNSNNNQVNNNVNNSNNTNNTNFNNNENNNVFNRINNIRKIRQETINNINNFNININQNKEKNIDKEIFQLKSEVRNQYLEMSDLFKQLKYNIKEAEQYKKGLDRETKVLNEELFKNRMADVLNKNMINRTYGENMNKNYEDLIANKNINTIDSNTNLEGTSNWIYYNKNGGESEIDNNANINNNGNENDLSLLAKTGKNIIELKGENELIPIDNNIVASDDLVSGFDMNRIDFMNEERKIADEKNKKSIMKLKRQMEREKILFDHEKPVTMEELYKDLNVIENLNHNLSPINKIETLKNNFDVDYGITNKEKKNLKSKFKK